MKKIYVLTECGCPLVHAKTELELIYWYKDRVKKFSGDTEDIEKIERLLEQFENSDAEELLDLFDQIMDILDFYEVNIFEIPSI